MSARKCSMCGICYPDKSAHSKCVCGEKTDPVGSSNPHDDWKQRAFEVYYRQRDDQVTQGLEAALEATPSIPDPEPSKDG